MKALAETFNECVFLENLYLFYYILRMSLWEYIYIYIYIYAMHSLMTETTGMVGQGLLYFRFNPIEACSWRSCVVFLCGNLHAFFGDVGNSGLLVVMNAMSWKFILFWNDKIKMIKSEKGLAFFVESVELLLYAPSRAMCRWAGYHFHHSCSQAGYLFLQNAPKRVCNFQTFALRQDYNGNVAPRQGI